MVFQLELSRYLTSTEVCLFKRCLCKQSTPGHSFSRCAPHASSQPLAHVHMELLFHADQPEALQPVASRTLALFGRRCPHHIWADEVNFGFMHMGAICLVVGMFPTSISPPRYAGAVGVRGGGRQGWWALGIVDLAGGGHCGRWTLRAVDVSDAVRLEAVSLPGASLMVAPLLIILPSVCIPPEREPWPTHPRPRRRMP